jgi:hypothetical protein
VEHYTTERPFLPIQDKAFGWGILVGEKMIAQLTYLSTYTSPCHSPIASPHHLYRDKTPKVIARHNENRLAIHKNVHERNKRYDPIDVSWLPHSAMHTHHYLKPMSTKETVHTLQ